MIGDGDGVAALMLRCIFRSIRAATPSPSPIISIPTKRKNGSATFSKRILAGRLRPGRGKSLQRHAKIRFENVALPFFRFVGIEMIGGGDGVAALMLRKIHRSVGHLDQFLRR